MFLCFGWRRQERLWAHTGVLQGLVNMWWDETNLQTPGEWKCSYCTVITANYLCRLLLKHWIISNTDMMMVVGEVIRGTRQRSVNVADIFVFLPKRWIDRCHATDESVSKHPLLNTNPVLDRCLSEEGWTEQSVAVPFTGVLIKYLPAWSCSVL